MAQGRWLACLNPDAFAHPDWLAALVAAAGRHPQAGMYASLQLDAGDPSRLDGVGDNYHAFGLAWRGDHGQSAVKPLVEQPVFGACAAAVLYDRVQFLALAGFDERFFCYFEDVDLAFRWRLAGGSCVFVPSAVVEHVGGATSSQVSGFARFHGTRNAVWCFVKNMPAPLFWGLLPCHAVLMAAMLARALVKGHGGVVASALAAAIKGLPQVWKDRRFVQSSRKISWREVAATLAWSPTALLRRDARFLAR